MTIATDTIRIGFDNLITVLQQEFNVQIKSKPISFERKKVDNPTAIQQRLAFSIGALSLINARSNINDFIGLETENVGRGADHEELSMPQIGLPLESEKDSEDEEELAPTLKDPKVEKIEEIIVQLQYFISLIEDKDSRAQAVSYLTELLQTPIFSDNKVQNSKISKSVLQLISNLNAYELSIRKVTFNPEVTNVIIPPRNITSSISVNPITPIHEMYSNSRDHRVAPLEPLAEGFYQDIDGDYERLWLRTEPTTSPAARYRKDESCDSPCQLKCSIS